jgi:hypothetical protein
MKRFLIILFVILCSCSFSQVSESFYLPSNSLQKYAEKTTSINAVSSACSTPDGTMLIATSVSSFGWLDTNGYCFSIGPQKNFTMCFTFNSVGTSVRLNSGYSTTGCFSITFSGFNFYTCAPSCTSVGTGSTFSGLTPGQCYTWCFSGNCGPGPGPGFSKVCPYWMNTSPLPITLISFICMSEKGQNSILWKTETETNNDYFELQRSIDGINFEIIAKIKGAGNSMSEKNYSYIDYDFKKAINYYRIKQVDYNGASETFNIIAVDNTESITKTVVKRISVLGTEVNEGYEGIYIEIYSDGSFTKKCCIINNK